MPGEVEIRAPAEQTEGTRSQILRWLKSVGEIVCENEPLIEIETDKVTVEVAAPGSGTLREIVKQERDEIGPGELLGRIESAAAASATAPPPAACAAEARPDEVSAAARIAVPSSDSVSAAAPFRSAASPAVHGHTQTDRGSAANLSPAVRRLLAKYGLEASSIRGTGQGSRVSVEDVLRHVADTTAGRSNGEAPGSGGLDSPPSESAAAVTGPAADSTRPSHRVPHSSVRKRIAEHMVQSLLHTAPHVTTVFEADLSAVLEHRRRNQGDFARRGAPLTLTAYFLQASVDAIRAVPEANSRWTDTALEIFDSIHIGVATALETGLIVPVLRDVQSRDLFQIAQGLDELVTRAREGRLAPVDVRGGTFTLSNHGVSGSLLATPIVINQPQAAILGVGKLEKRVVAIRDGDGDGDGDGEERIVMQPRCYVTLTIDHRVMDGHQANRFLQTFVRRLAAWPP